MTAKIVSLEDIQRIFLQGNPQLAEQYFLQMISQKPTDWPPCFFYAAMLCQLERYQLAIPLLYRCVDIEPKQFESWNNLGTILRRDYNHEEALRCLLKALELQPESPQVLNNLGTLFINEGEPGQSQHYLELAIKHRDKGSDDDFYKASWNLGLALLEQGTYERGWHHYCNGVKAGDRVNRWVSWPYWDGKPGQKVLTYGEQGLGDEIMFLSMIPDMIEMLGEENVFVECHPRLEKMIRRAWPLITVEPTRKLSHPQWEHEFDARIPLGDLGRYLRPDWDSFPREPYFTPDADLVRDMRDRLEATGLPGPYIAVSWKGGYKRTHKIARTVPIEIFTPLAGMGTLVSMQYTPDADEETRAFTEKTGIPIIHWPDVVRGQIYDYNMALAAACDQVVCVNTTLVHGCGSHGIPCITLTPKRAAWRYFPYYGSMAWYSSVTMYSETKKGFERTIKNVVKALRPKLGFQESA